MANEKKKRGSNMIPEQKNDLIQYMKSHPQLDKGTFSNNFTFKNAQQFWMEIGNHLNAQPGARKDWKMWRKTWQDLKAATKRKQSLIKVDKMKTGGGPPINLELTLAENEIAEFIAPSVSQGHNALESNAQFVFNDIEETVADVPELFEETPDVLGEIELNTIPNLHDHTYLKVNFQSSSSSSSETKSNDENTIKGKGKIRKPVRVERLSEAIGVSIKLAELTEKKLSFNKEYHNSKLQLMREDIVAKNRVAAAIETIAEVLKNK